jgi:hypothetical protein
MQRYDVRRLVVLSASGTAPGRDPNLPWVFDRVIKPVLLGPAWTLSELWWTAASDDLSQLAALDALGWSRELRVPARAGREWVFRAPS